MIDVTIFVSQYCIRRFKVASIRGVHCDEITTGGIQLDISAFKHETQGLGIFGSFNGVYLHGHH